MYKLIFEDRTVVINTLEEWHIEMCSLNKKGIYYKRFVRCNYVWKFFF